MTYQVIEQIAVADSRSVDAKIIGGGDQTGTEVIIPDPVDQYTGRNGVRVTGQPLGEQRPTTIGSLTRFAGLFDEFLRPGRQVGEKARHDLVCRAKDITIFQNKGVGSFLFFSGIADGHDTGFETLFRFEAVS